MRISNINRKLKLAAVLLSVSVLLSSCGITSLLGSSAKSDIKKAAAAYLDEIQDGSFTDNEYESVYAEDAPFSELVFADPDVQEIMDRGMKKIEYSVDSAEGSVKDGEGTCDVTVTAVNVEDALAGLNGEELTADSFMDAIKDKDAPTEDYKITLDMIYDSSSKDWLVSDSGPLAEILGDPYTEVTFGPAAGDPADAVETFMIALAQGDTAVIDEISPYYDSSNFFESEQYVMNMQMAFYGNVSYQYNGDPVVSDAYADVNITLTYPDLSAIVNYIVNDSQFMAEFMKPYLLAYIEGSDTAAAENESLQLFSDKTAELLHDPNAPMLTADSVFTLEVNAETGKWDIYEVPAELYDIHAEPDMSDEMYTEASLLALDMLFQEGSIDQAAYDAYRAELGGTTVPSDTSLAAGSSMASDVAYYFWYDNDYGIEVYSFDSAYSTSIEFDIYFNNSWPGTTIYAVWYNNNGTSVYTTMEYTMTEEDTGYYTYILPAEGSYMPADTYRVVLSLADGTVITDQSVTCY